MTGTAIPPDVQDDSFPSGAPGLSLQLYDLSDNALVQERSSIPEGLCRFGQYVNGILGKSDVKGGNT